jgi:hypothetical protein
MRNKGKSLSQLLNEKARILVFILTYIPLLKIALSYNVEEPYITLIIYLLFPLLGGIIVMLIYDKIINSLKSKKQYR